MQASDTPELISSGSSPVLFPSYSVQISETSVAQVSVIVAAGVCGQHLCQEMDFLREYDLLSP